MILKLLLIILLIASGIGYVVLESDFFNEAKAINDNVQIINPATGEKWNSVKEFRFRRDLNG